MKDRRLYAIAFLMAMVALLFAASYERPALAARGEEGTRSTPTPDQPTPPDGGEAPEAMPDLVVSAINVSPNPLIVNGPVTITVIIRNIGPGPVAPTNNFFVDLYLNPSVPPRACVPGQYYWGVQGYQLADNIEFLTVTINPRTDPLGAVFRTTGVVQIWAQVDNATNAAGNQCGNVVETREDNNIRSTAVDVDTRTEWKQTSAEEFQSGYSSALDLTHPNGVLQNGTGWFFEPRFPRPEETHPAWAIQNSQPWNSPHFYNPDHHVAVDNFPDNYPPGQISTWNPPDQENADIKVVRVQEQTANQSSIDYIFAVWEDARNGDQNNRDIYFRFSDDSGVNWYDPVRVNQDPISSAKNQLNPTIVIAEVDDPTVVPIGKRPVLFVFWEDWRLNDSDIFFARSLDYGVTWQEPTLANPVNDKNINPTADQKNVTAGAIYVNVDRGTPEGAASCPLPDPAFNAFPGCVYLYVAWEDYRNGNADVYFEWSRNGGMTWLRNDDGNPSTIDGNVFVQPDPSSNAGIFDQGRPSLAVSTKEVTSPFNNCISSVVPQIYYDQNGNEIYRTRLYYTYQPLPMVYLAWEDDRESLSGVGSQIYYTRGEFNYNAPDNFPAGYSEPTNCTERAPLESTPFLPAYRFEDDQLKADVNQGGAVNVQQEPTIDFNPNGFRSFPYEQSYIDSNGNNWAYQCEVRWGTEEMLLSWQDDRDGTFDIWSNSVLDRYTDVQVAIILENAPPDFWVPLYSDPRWQDPNLALQYMRTQTRGCLSDNQALPVGGVMVAGLAELDAPIDRSPTIVRNASLNSPQPPRFLELAFPSTALKISNGTTFKEKPYCLAPNEPTAAPIEPSQQTEPDLAVLATDPVLQGVAKEYVTNTLQSDLMWNIWVDTRSLDEVNQDLFLRPVVRYDTEDSLSVTQPNGEPIYLQTVQDNVKNQLSLRRRDVFPDLLPPNAQQSAPSIDFYDRDGFATQTSRDYALYAIWHDNRNANPYLGFEGNKDVFTARLQIDDPLYGGDYGLRPLRSGSFLSSVFGDGLEKYTWYDIEWWGDISADGSLTLQTRLGYDASNPQPPQEDITTYTTGGQVAWTRWTGIGGVGGAYSVPGQLITDTNNTQKPQSFYVQYRVNFNRQGKEGIHCVSEIVLNYELEDRVLYLPIVMK